MCPFSDPADLLWAVDAGGELVVHMYFIPVQPGTLNNQFQMDGNGETTTFYVVIWFIIQLKQPFINLDVSGSRNVLTIPTGQDEFSMNKIARGCVPTPKKT